MCVARCVREGWVVSGVRGVQDKEMCREEERRSACRGCG